MNNEIEQIAQQNKMSIEFVTWFFNEKKSACGEHWFLMLGAMWEGWKGRSIEMDKLAAENVALKSSRAILAENALETCNEVYTAGFRNTALHDGLMESTGNRNKYPNPIRTLVDEAKRNIETPATDRIVAGIKADAIDEAAVELDRVDTVASTRVIGFKLREFSQQLREGAK
ncbi:hypothetical protein AB0118_07460 [Klebsiella quasipneumoniae]|uniref:hypothetical protein n=1 Tax=Klebsiella quasipneumoniae TaxID=1463165 RepID=UPI002406280C|nr:hypothetical protein [Klebsiella quasipneumoniae]MDG0556561.1 hypothetical protein [Klebsiella quasipneumoniae]